MTTLPGQKSATAVDWHIVRTATVGVVVSVVRESGQISLKLLFISVCRLGLRAGTRSQAKSHDGPETAADAREPG